MDSLKFTIQCYDLHGTHKTNLILLLVGYLEVRNKNIQQHTFINIIKDWVWNYFIEYIKKLLVIKNKSKNRTLLIGKPRIQTIIFEGQLNSKTPYDSNFN